MASKRKQKNDEEKDIPSDCGSFTGSEGEDNEESDDDSDSNEQPIMQHLQNELPVDVGNESENECSIDEDDIPLAQLEYTRQGIQIPQWDKTLPANRIQTFQEQSGICKEILEMTEPPTPYNIFRRLWGEDLTDKIVFETNFYYYPIGLVISV
ncbi:unnamed protein product [Rotaria socialis]|uniref:PiggyBac transposable element-derived protein domain-containing protein n=2 Tax=Rotaria socialis TaxID=392032 RepID=A0A821UBF9_9BILA|nr:unnamed protein product [Rotaria socialis]